MLVCNGDHMSSLIPSSSICGKTHPSLLARKYFPIWHLQNSINPRFLFPLCCGLCGDVTEHKCPFNVLTNRNMVHSVLHADPKELLKDSEKCHLHRLPSGVKFIQTRWSRHWITFSRHTMRTKGGDSRGSDKDLAKTPSLYIFSVLVGGQKTTPPPVLTLCALSEPPHHLGFLYYWVGWPCKSQWGSWTTGAGAFST